MRHAHGRRDDDAIRPAANIDVNEHHHGRVERELVGAELRDDGLSVNKVDENLVCPGRTSDAEHTGSAVEGCKDSALAEKSRDVEGIPDFKIAAGNKGRGVWKHDDCRRARRGDTDGNKPQGLACVAIANIKLAIDSEQPPDDQGIACGSGDADVIRRANIHRLKLRRAECHLPCAGERSIDRTCCGKSRHNRASLIKSHRHNAADRVDTNIAQFAHAGDGYHASSAKPGVTAAVGRDEAEDEAVREI